MPAAAAEQGRPDSMLQIAAAPVPVEARSAVMPARSMRGCGLCAAVFSHPRQARGYFRPVPLALIGPRPHIPIQRQLILERCRTPVGVP